MMLVMLWSRIPKTGSTSLHQRLHSDNNARRIDNTELSMAEYPNAIVLEAGHRTPRYLVEHGLLKQQTLRSAFVFSTVRNPWARFASLWFGIGNDYKTTDDFNEWLARILSDRSMTASEDGTPLGSTQDEWLLLDGLPICDLVMRMESLDEGYRILSDKIGDIWCPLATMNMHPHPPYTELYSTESIEAVGRAERYVIETYGYRFGEDRKMDIPRLSGAE